MNKKVAKIVLPLIFILWIIYVIIDCIRIDNFNDKPFITISEQSYDNVEKIDYPNENIEVGEYGTTYIGLGYTKRCYRKWQLDKSITRMGYCTYLFGFIVVNGFEYH